MVMYIPAPPEEEGKDETGEAKPADSVTVPKPAYTYPPTSPSKPQPSGRKRFRFAFLQKKKSVQGDGEGEHKAGVVAAPREPQTWEENWVPNGLPFVRLEGNRAACAICLMDYEEPPRAKGSRLPPRPAEEPPVGTGEAQHVRVEEHVTDEQLRLADAGEVAQPLRLLPCGHVFHVSSRFVRGVGCEADERAWTEHVSRPVVDGGVGALPRVSAACRDTGPLRQEKEASRAAADRARAMSDDDFRALDFQDLLLLAQERFPHVKYVILVVAVKHSMYCLDLHSSPQMRDLGEKIDLVASSAPCLSMALL